MMRSWVCALLALAAAGAGVTPSASMAAGPGIPGNPGPGR